MGKEETLFNKAKNVLYNKVNNWIFSWIAKNYGLIQKSLLVQM